MAFDRLRNIYAISLLTMSLFGFHLFAFSVAVAVCLKYSTICILLFTERFQQLVDMAKCMPV